jgi:hypothetical protein
MQSVLEDPVEVTSNFQFDATSLFKNFEAKLINVFGWELAEFQFT